MSYQTYKIIRFRFNGRQTVVKRGLSLEQAQEHCKDDSTSKRNRYGEPMWFDGYTVE